MDGVTIEMQTGFPATNRPVSEPTGQDDALLARIAKGDQLAFGQLMQRHLDRAHAVAYRIAGNRGDAEDAVQDSFIKVWTRAAEWQPGRAQFSTWLYRVVVNRCLDLKRRPRGTDLDAIDEPADDRPDALDDLLTAERQAQIAAAIEALPQRQRTAIVLTYTAALGNVEAADIMEVSLKAFESLLVRAKRELRASLTGGEPAMASLPKDGKP